MAQDYEALEKAFRVEFTKAKEWMEENDAEAIARNLAPGADAATLDAFEKRIGFPIPLQLRALWSVHDGQHEEGNGFYGSYDLFSTALADVEGVTRFLPYLREPKSASGVAESKMTPAELASDRWLRIAGRDSDGIALNAESGRVFHITHDDFPALHLAAPSLLAWFEQYCIGVAEDDYDVEEGFGGVYLEERDRKGEARETARKAEEKRRLTAPPLQILDEMIGKKQDDVILQALLRTQGAEREAFLATLFAKAGPELIASTLRPKANDLMLTREQWEVVAKGAALIPNHALKALAEKKLQAL